MKQIKNRKKNFKKSLKALSKVVIQIGAVGRHDPPKEKEGSKRRKEGPAKEPIMNNYLLEIHEFGLGDNPARAPITKTMLDEGNRKEFKRTIQKLIEVNYDVAKATLDVNTIADGMGIFFRGKVKKTILDGVEPDITEETKKRSDPRKGDVPLDATGQLLDTIEYGVLL
jgi:hypothetical protein